MRLLEKVTAGAACGALGMVAGSWWVQLAWHGVALAVVALVAALADTWFNARAAQADNATAIRLEALEAKVEALQKVYALQSLR